MFGTLLESRHMGARREGGALVSILAHGAVIGAVVVGTARATQPPDPREPVVVEGVRYLVPAPAPRAPASPAPQPTEPATPAPASPAVPVPQPAPVNAVVPDLSRIPSTLPPVGAPLGEALARVDADAGLPRGGVVGDGSPAAGEAWDAGAVERVATLRTRVEPVYPRALASSGLEGRAVLRFVVDTSGRVEGDGIIVVESTHPLFAAAARAALARARFVPAEVGGRRVRMLAEMPFLFSMAR